MPTEVRRLSFGPSGTASTGSFREYVRFIHDAFNGSGFVNTFPSGAINTASVDPPTAQNQVRGYNVWAFGDVSQSAAPQFIRVEFRSLQSSTFNAWGLNLYFGNRHDGSGNLVDLPFTRSITLGSAGAGGAFTAQQSASCLWTGESGSRVAVIMGAYASGAGADYAIMWFNINRINDWNGGLTPSGVIMHYGGGSGSSPRAGHAYISREIGKNYIQSSGHVILLSTTVNTGSGGTTAISPLFTGKGVINPHSYDVFMVNSAQPDYVITNGNITGSQYILNVYDVNRNFIRLPRSVGGDISNQLYNFNAASALLFRYE